jgi:hypothetical protein
MQMQMGEDMHGIDSRLLQQQGFWKLSGPVGAYTLLNKSQGVYNVLARDSKEIQLAGEQGNKQQVLLAGIRDGLRYPRHVPFPLHGRFSIHLSNPTSSSC